jgi:hypothetical protein
LCIGSGCFGSARSRARRRTNISCRRSVALNFDASHSLLPGRRRAAWTKVAEEVEGEAGKSGIWSAPLSLSARANHTRAICREGSSVLFFLAVCAIFKHSAANRRYSCDRDIREQPPFGTVGRNAERVYGDAYGLAGSFPSSDGPIAHLRRPCWAQRDSNRPAKPHLENRFPADPDDMPRPFVGTLGVLGTVLLLSIIALAQPTPEESKSPVSNESERHVFNYGDHDRTCIHWTDKCRTCNRGISADIVCSNIGIACQPTEVECLERQQSDDKK